MQVGAPCNSGPAFKFLERCCAPDDAAGFGGADVGSRTHRTQEEERLKASCYDDQWQGARKLDFVPDQSRLFSACRGSCSLIWQKYHVRWECSLKFCSAESRGLKARWHLQSVRAACASWRTPQDCHVDSYEFVHVPLKSMLSRPCTLQVLLTIARISC